MDGVSNIGKLYTQRFWAHQVLEILQLSNLVFRFRLSFHFLFTFGPRRQVMGTTPASNVGGPPDSEDTSRPTKGDHFAALECGSPTMERM